MGIYQVIKEQVTTREAAEYYGIPVNRNGMAKCIFHDDRNPSMKLDRRYHCFGCQADGDVIDFVGKMFGLSPYEAARKLVSDFGIYVPGKNHFHGRKANTAAPALASKDPGKNPADMSSTEDPDRKQTNEKVSGEACKEKTLKPGQKKSDKDNKAETEEKKKERRIRRLERQIRSWIERAEITLIQYLIYLEEWEARYRPAGPGENLHPLFCEAVSRASIVRYQLETLLHGTDEDRLDFSRRKERG